MALRTNYTDSELQSGSHPAAHNDANREINRVVDVTDDVLVPHVTDDGWTRTSNGFYLKSTGGIVNAVFQTTDVCGGRVKHGLAEIYVSGTLRFGTSDASGLWYFQHGFDFTRVSSAESIVGTWRGDVGANRRAGILQYRDRFSVTLRNYLGDTFGEDFDAGDEFSAQIYYPTVAADT